MLVFVVALETSLKVFAQVVASWSVHEINAERRREGGVGRNTFHAWTGGWLLDKGWHVGMSCACVTGWSVHSSE